MIICVDADACPVTRIVETNVRKHGIYVILLCDTNHQLTSDYSTVKVIKSRADAIHQSRRWYTDNINGLMMERHLARDRISARKKRTLLFQRVLNG